MVVAVKQVHLDVGDGNTCRLRFGNKWTDFRPGAVDTHEEVGCPG